MKKKAFRDLSDLDIDDPIKSPDVQDIILSGQIGCIAAEISRRLAVSPAQALAMFYESKTCEHLHNKATGLYLQGNLYIVDEFLAEKSHLQM